MGKRIIIATIILILLYIYILLCHTVFSNTVLYTIVPTCFVLAIISNPPKPSIYLVLLFLLYVWVSLTYFVATNTDYAKEQIHQIIGCFLFAVPIYYVSVKHYSKIMWVYGLWFVYFFVCLYQLRDINFYSFSEEDRVTMENGGFNANHFGQYTVYLTFILYLFGELNNKLRNLFWIIVPIAFFIALITASRQVLILEIPLIAILFYLRYIKFGNRKSLSWFVLILLIAVPLLYNTVVSIYDNSFLAQRSELEVKDDARIRLVIGAIKVGLEHPLFGVGPGNYRLYSFNHFSYSHNTFTELFANTGIFGFAIYFSMIAIFLKRQLKRYKRTKDPMYITFFVFGVFYALDNFFISFYTSILLISFFILLSTHSEEYYKSSQRLLLIKN